VGVQWRRGLICGLCSVAAYTIVLWAMTRAPVAAVAALRETSVLFAALARLLLPARRVGLLVVRSRAFDVVVLAGMGMALVVLAIVVPPDR